MDESRGKLGQILFVLIVIIVIIIAFNKPTKQSNTVERNGILQTTVAKEKLKTKSQLLIGYDNYTNDIETNKDKRYLNKGLEEFYEKTGVPPYLIIINQEDVFKYLDEVEYGYVTSESENIRGTIGDTALGNYTQVRYERLFGNSKVHFLVVGCITSNGDYKYDYLVGEDAEDIIDIEAWDIFNSCLLAFNKDDYTEAEWIYNVYVNAANNIMEPAVTVSGVIWDGLDFIKNSVVVIIVIIGIIFITVFTICAVAMIKSVQRSKKAELESKLSQVLDSINIDTDEDEEIKKLEEKYGG